MKPEIVSQWTYNASTVVLKKTSDPVRVANNQAYYLVVDGKVKYPTKDDGVTSEALAMTWAAVNGWVEGVSPKEEIMKEETMKVKLNAKQAEAYEAIVNGSENILLTGNAGTGKSFLTNLVVDALVAKGKNVVVTATTGIAGTHINGQTYARALRILPKDNKGKEMSLTEMVEETIKDMKGRKGFVDFLKSIDVVFVDEVSMMSPYDFARIDAALRHILNKPNKPFGGVRFVFVGDFLQIEPVNKRKISLYSFAFQTKVWKNNGIRTIQLTEVVRQQDAMFAAFLNNFRQGIASSRTLRLAKERMVDDQTIIPEGTVYLSTHNKECDDINAKKLAEIEGETFTYEAQDSSPDKYNPSTGDWTPDKDYWDKNCLAPKVLSLKVGAQVLVLKNDEDGVVVNGDTGIVTSLDERWVTVYIPRLDREETFNPVYFCQEQLQANREPIHFRMQFPLKLGWAITVHKSQGMTLDAAIVSVKDAFTAGQLYVAFSRVRSLQGLFIKSFDREKILAHKDALEFYGLPGNVSGQAAEEICYMRKLEEGGGYDDSVRPIQPQPTRDGGSGKATPVATKGAPMSTPTPAPAPATTPAAKTPQGSATVNMTPSGGGNIMEYLVDMPIGGTPALGLPGRTSVSRIVTNDPEYWLKHDNAVVIEQVDRGGYHYALLEHLFGHTSFAVNLTSYNDPIKGKPQMVFTHSPTVPKDSIFGWANFDSETIIRVKGHGHKGWSNMSQFGLHVANSEKMTKRLVEIAKASRGYKINTKANGDRMLKILVLTHDQILRAFPSLEDEYYAEKGFDGVSVMAVEKAKDVYRNNVHMPKRATAKLLKQIDNLEVTNHTLRIITNVDGVAGEVKGNVLTGKRAKINARLVELGLSDGKVSYDVVTSVDNLKKELGTDGSWEIITLEPHHGPGMVKTNDQTLAQFQGIPGIFSFDEILAAFQTVMDDYGDKIKSGKDIEWIKDIRTERPVTEADTFDQLRGSINKDLMHIYGVYNDLGLDIGTNQTLTHMRVTFLKKMFLSEDTPQGMNWKASSKEKKSFMFMPWAYRAYVMTKEVIYLAGYDIDLKNANCGYHKETQTFAMPGKLWGDVCVKLGGADLDDELMIHIRKFVELDGSERLGALLIRTPNDWAEYAIVDVKVPGPVFVNKLDMPTVNMRDLVKFKQSSKCGKLPSKVNGSQRPNPLVWDYTCARYNYLISGNIVGGVGGQVKVKMLRYAIYDKPFSTLPCPNEDMIDAIQQCKGDANDLTTLRRWADREIYNILTGRAMDAYWFYSRKMGQTADALNINPTSFISADRSPIVRDLMVPREEMILDLYRELDAFLKREIHEIEEIKDVFDSKDQEWTYRKRVMKIVKDNRDKSLDDAATDILDRFIAFENANGIEATNLLILRMVRASYLVKKDMGGANWDNWLVSVVPNSNLQVIDFFYRAMVWHRKRRNK